MKLKVIIEGLLLAANEPLTCEQLVKIVATVDENCGKKEVQELIDELNNDYAERGIEIRELASGFQLHVKDELSQWVAKLWETRPQRYSKALLEILALIAYKQPVTRGEIEEVRGVAVSSDIVKRLFDREWIKIVGHKDVPGRPALFATTNKFLDYFGLKSLSELPTLPEFSEEEDEDEGEKIELPTLDQKEIELDVDKASENPVGTTRELSTDVDD